MKFHHSSLLLALACGAVSAAQERPLRFQGEVKLGQEPSARTLFRDRIVGGGRIAGEEGEQAPRLTARCDRAV